MKKLFSVLAIAMVAFAAFAFTPKGEAFAEIYHFDTFTGTWVEGGGGSCPGSAQACRYTSNIALDATQRAEVAGLIGSNTTARTITTSFGPVDVSGIALRP